MQIATVPPLVATPDGWFLTSDGAQIPYRIKGRGPALIMIHGWSQSGAMFQHQLDGLSKQFTVIVPDIRGHGEAPDLDVGLRISRLSRDLAELMEHLRLDRCMLLGWSMGASVIWSYVDLFGTSRVDKFVFVDQPSMLTVMPDMDVTEATECGALFTLAEMGNLYAALRSPDGDKHRAGFVDGMVTKTISPQLLDWIQAENAKTSTAVAASLFFSHCTNDWRNLLKRIDRPTLVTGGAVSHVNPASQRHIHALISGSEYYEFSADEGGAHYPFLEAPNAFDRVVGTFLAGNRA